MEQTGVTASSRARIVFCAVALAMFALWGWSLLPVIANWNNPYDDGFSVVGVFYATPICLPIGYFLLKGALAGQGRSAQRARIAIFLGGGVLFIVVAFLIFQYIANSIDGM